MELVKLWYKYLNRFINSDELLETLQNLDLNKYTIDTKSEIKRLIKDIKKIKEEIPNEIDEVEEKRLENINFFLDKLNEIDKNNCDKEAWNIISKKIENLKKEKLLVRDGGALYNSILEKLNNCYSIFKYLHRMTDLELLDFLTEYISVPIPLKIDENKFLDLVELGIENDQKESLWRLAFTYENKHFNYNNIINYFIKEKDIFYITESLYAFKDSIDMNNLYDKLIKLNDKEFLIKIFTPGIMELLDNKDIDLMIKKGINNNILTKEEIEKLQSFKH